MHCHWVGLEIPCYWVGEESASAKFAKIQRPDPAMEEPTGWEFE